MSRESISLFEQAKAIALCEEVIAQLRLEIAAGPKRVQAILVEMAQYLIDRSGGSDLSARLRRDLAECQRLIDAREVARRREQIRAINCRDRGVS